jgi:hypothetical protein
MKKIGQYPHKVVKSPFGRSREFAIPSSSIINTHEKYEIICNTCVNVR